MIWHEETLAMFPTDDFGRPFLSNTGEPGTFLVQNTSPRRSGSSLSAASLIRLPLPPLVLGVPLPKLINVLLRLTQCSAVAPHPQAII